VVSNPPVTFEDGEGYLSAPENWSRRDQFHTFKPLWWHYALTKDDGCGCRRRFGLWYTVHCWEHVKARIGL
jgi:hypothetical protein